MPGPPTEIDRFDALANDPQNQAYIDPGTKQLVFKGQTDDPALLAQRQARGLQQATPEDIEARRAYLKNTTAGEQAASAGKLAANVATFGLSGFTSPEDRKKITDFKEASPTLAALTEMAGAAAPAALTGGAAGLAGEALGLAPRAAELGSVVAEEISQSTAIENERALEAQDGIDLGNIVQGLPLALGISAAGRIARGATRRVRGAVEAGAVEAGAGSTLEEAASAENNVIERARATSRARRSVGAAGAGPDTRPPMSEQAVREGAVDFEPRKAQANELGYAAVGDSVGGTDPSFDAVHNIGLKKGDIAGRMQDASPEATAAFATEHSTAVQELADQLAGSGQGAAAKQLLKHVADIEGAESVEDLALHFDQTKRTLDRLRTRYGLVRDTVAEGIVGDIDAVVNPIRDGLEDSGTWGKLWAEKQATENKLWSADDGIIRSGAVWQHEFLERAPGAAGSMRRGLKEVPVFKVRGDLAEHAIGMNEKDFALTSKAWKQWIDKAEAMSQLKTELGVASVEHTPVMRLQQSLNDMRHTIDELDALREIKARGGEVIARTAQRAQARSFGETAFDAAKELPFGAGAALRGADRVAESISGKSLRDRLFEPKIAPPQTSFTRETARAAILKRRGGEPGGSGPSGGQPPPQPPSGLADQLSRVKPPAAGAGSPVSLAGKSLKDLGALEDPTTFKQETLAALRTGKGGRGDFASDFGSTGRVNQKGQFEQGIQVELRDGKPRLVDGRHRVMVGREKGLTEVYGQIYDGARAPGKKPIYEGPIPIAENKEAGFADLAGGIAKSPLGVTIGAGLAGLGVTRALAEISDHNKAIQERAGLGLVSKASRAPKLESLPTRFKEGAPDLQTAFTNKLNDLKDLDQNPQAFLDGMTDTFGGIARAGHEDLFTRVVARVQIGSQYLLANAPPSVAYSIAHPDGIPPDTIAVMKWAAMHDAVFNPGNVVYEVGTGDATPTQIRALREVHPDIYGNLRAEALKQVSQAGPKIPFETLRQLDSLFNLDGVAGPAFGPSMVSTMAQAYAAQATKSPKQSLSGESVIAPSSATAKFDNGPSSIA
jgi:hypothetical protein